MVSAPSPRRERPTTPQVFGRYLLLKRLSRGGMGEIFLGRLGEIQGFEKPVIIKKILPQLAADEGFVARFVNEAQVAIQLNHANIAAVYEVGKVDGDYFLALEYVEGRDLRRLLARARAVGFRLPPDLCLYIGRELASGLGYAHRRTDSSGQHLSLVHCDISPPNVMVSFEGEVKIIDFGIAKSALRLAEARPEVGFGKLGYMAPEQLVKGGVIDRRTDVYAAGALLYELLTGEHLFDFPEGADYHEIARVVSRGEFAPPSQRSPGLDPSLDAIVLKALASRPEGRFQTAEELRDAIQARLSRMNPTLSSDALAHLVQGLFAEELSEERALATRTRQVDVGEYRDELEGSVGHTVTFARAGTLQASLPERLVSSLSSSRSRRRRRAILVGSSLAVLAALPVGYLIVRGAWSPSPRAVPPSQAASSLPGSTPAPVRLVSSPVAPIQPVVVEAVETEAPPVPARLSPHRPRRIATRSALPAMAPAEAVGAPESTALVERERLERRRRRVEGKFLAVKSEYTAFRGEYGPRLEGEWNAIAREITFGKPSEKYDHVDELLDALRRSMAAVRTGG